MKRAVVVATLALVVGLFGGASSPAAAQVRECDEYATEGYCISWNDEQPGGGGGSAGGTGVSTGVPACYWEALPAPPDMSGLVQPPPDVPVVWQRWVCPGEADPGPGGPAVPIMIRWVEAVTVTPEELASAAFARLARRLPGPEVVSSPPAGTAAIIDVPVFVAVSNWTGALSESECAAGLCVTVTATPQLTFSPGEPGSGTIECAGSGTGHVAGTDPMAAAQRPGACAHAYRHRTGIGGRPATWPGEVTVTWTIAWTASGGATGTLPTVTRTSLLPRAVEEVQSIVVAEHSP